MIRLQHLVVRNFKCLREIDLAFPPSGSVLIEGLNESGKSTLFESIYFALYGRPLVTEGTIESSVRYGCQESFVELALEVDATTLLIQRRTRTQGQNRGRLVVRLPDGTEEEVARARAMNDRIVAELGKLDGDTLLNSCFVEQKKLQRLESLDVAARRESLLRLLNLDNLTALENQFKLSRQDDQALAVAQARLTLATVRDAIPLRQAELEQTERQVVAWHVRTALGRHAAATDGLAEADRELSRLGIEQAALDSRLALIADLAAVERQVETVGRAVEERQRAADEADTRQQELDALDRLADEELPQLDAQRASLASLAARLGRLETVEQGLAWLGDGDANARAANEAETEIAKHEADRDTVAERLQRLTTLREAGQSADRLADRLAQHAAASADRQRSRQDLAGLETVRDGLPARRVQAEALVTTAADLDAARQQHASAERQIGLVDDLAAAETALATATDERMAAERKLRETTTKLTAARRELADARSARSPSVRPLITAWTAARAEVDGGEAATSARDKADQRLAWARQGLQRAEARRSATAQRSMLGISGGGVGLVAGLVLAVLGFLVAGGPVLIAGLAALAFGIRERTRLAAGQQEVSKFVRAVELAQQGLADINARLTLTESARARLAEAERSLESVGERVPASIDEARARLAADEERDRAADAAASRERTLDDAVSRLTREEGQAQGNLERAGEAIEQSKKRLAVARAALGADPRAASADAATLRDTCARHLDRAGRQLTAVRAQADAFGAGSTAEDLRRLAAVAQAAISQDEQKVAGIPSVELRVDADGARLSELSASLTHERRTLDARLVTLGQPPFGESDDAALTTLRQRIATWLRNADDAALQQERSCLEAAVGAARQSAEQHRERARAAWQRANEAGRVLSKDAAADVADTESGTKLVRLAEAAVAGEAIDSGPLRESTGGRRQVLVAEAEQLAVPLTQNGLRDAVTVLTTRRAQIEKQLGSRPSFVERRDAAIAEIATLDRQIADAWEAIDRRLAEIEQVAPARDTASLLAKLHASREALDEAGTRSRRDDVLADVANARASASAFQAERATAAATITAQLRTVALDSPVEPAPNALMLVLPELANPSPVDLDVLEIERRRLDGVLGGLQAEQDRLEGQWGLAGVALETVACQTELDRLRRSKAIKERATRIIRTARGNLISRVLPSTEHNLRLLLPNLTTQRYRDATLSDEYRLQVWDADAGRYVAKEIFSGGTKDQFSLALRLAFALATLPQELGTTPGFIFLDEPLSAFDHPRTAALVELLTSGQIAKSFAQIFLISHSRAFDPALFPYYLRMHEGRVAETNLASPMPIAS